MEKQRLPGTFRARCGRLADRIPALLADTQAGNMCITLPLLFFISPPFLIVLILLLHLRIFLLHHIFLFLLWISWRGHGQQVQ